MSNKSKRSEFENKHNTKIVCRSCTSSRRFVSLSKASKHLKSDRWSSRITEYIFLILQIFFVQSNIWRKWKRHVSIWKLITKYWKKVNQPNANNNQGNLIRERKIKLALHLIRNLYYQKYISTNAELRHYTVMHYQTINQIILSNN